MAGRYCVSHQRGPARKKGTDGVGRSEAERGAARPTPTRRSTAEVRTLILASARKLFSIHGYRGTSTRDVASAAGVTAAAIYRHFGNKEGLFEAAVEEPLHATVDGFLNDWEFIGSDQRNNEAAARLFMKSVVALLRDNRELFAAYLQGRAGRAVEESALSRELGNVVDRVRTAIEGQGLVGVDVPVTVRCVTGMLMSTVLYDDFLFPPTTSRQTTGYSTRRSRSPCVASNLATPQGNRQRKVRTSEAPLRKPRPAEVRPAALAPCPRRRRRSLGLRCATCGCRPQC